MNILIKKNLQEENDLMKKIIAKKTGKLKRQYEDIKALLGQQSDFLAVTAHEFRTPLSIAMFQLEDTLRSHDHKPSILDEMKTMEDSLKNLKTLMQRLFDVQQYDLSKVQLNKVNLHLQTFLRKICMHFESMIDGKGIELSFVDNTKKDIFIDLDESQMLQVFHNLLDNAIKFAKKITLKVEKQNSSIVIKLIDNGQAVADSEKFKIFEKFQTQKSSMGVGIGLGLYLCKKIVELHDGEIWVEDTKGGGSTFCVELS